GVELPADGRYTVKVWAPARQTWSLKAQGQTLTLTSRAEGQDLTPRWQTLGTVDLRDDAPVKVVVANPASEIGKDKDKEKGKEAKPAAKSDEKPSPPPAVPAVLALAIDPGYDPAQALDLIRGRTDSVDPPADPRRAHVRTNREGADFHPPATEQAWRD